MDFRERLEQSRLKVVNGGAEFTESTEDFACDYFATDNIKSLPACLDLRLPDGRRKALPYSYFMEVDFYEGTTIEITTTTKRVKITGRDLGRLYDYLVAYRVRYVTCNLGADLDEEGLFIGSITIEES